MLLFYRIAVCCLWWLVDIPIMPHQRQDDKTNKQYQRNAYRRIDTQTNERSTVKSYTSRQGEKLEYDTVD